MATRTNPDYEEPRRKWYCLYVDDKYVGDQQTAWPILRLLRQLEREYPDASSWEVRAQDKTFGTSISKTKSGLPLLREDI